MQFRGLICSRGNATFGRVGEGEGRFAETSKTGGWCAASVVHPDRRDAAAAEFGTIGDGRPYLLPTRLEVAFHLT